MTIREHLEAIKRMSVDGSLEKQHAAAALALLDAADVFYPVPSTHYGDPEAVHRMVPDPVPVASRNAP